MNKVTWYFGEVASGKSTVCFKHDLPSDKRPSLLTRFVPSFHMGGAMAMFDDGKTDVIMVDRVHGDMFRSLDIPQHHFVRLLL